MAEPTQAPPPPPPRRGGDDGGDGGGGDIPEWIVTFADMMSLLLCFFILLLSFAKTDIAKFQAALGSIQDAFGVQRERPQDIEAAFSPTTESQVLNPEKLDTVEKEQLEVARMLKELINEKAEIAKNAIISAEEGGINLRVNSRALFEPGSARLLPGGEEVTKLVHAIMLKHKYDLIVEGHTGAREPFSSQFPTHWELSAARAVTLVRHILALGVSPRRLKAVGYGDTRPLVPENDDTGELNRRVEFFFRPQSGNPHL